jgi:Domain of unknown function (DUF3427)
MSLDELLKKDLWSQLFADAGLALEPVAPDVERLSKGIRRLCHIDDVDQIRAFLRYLDGTEEGLELETSDERRLTMMHISLWSEESLGWSVQHANLQLRQNPAAMADLRAVLEYRLSQAPARHIEPASQLTGPLAIHSQYTRDEILVGLGHWTLKSRPGQREGVLHLPQAKLDAFFVTLQKTEEEYSPTTMYEDYLISHELFHWQSQSITSAESPTGQRYIHHRELGYTPLLFVRETKALSSGISAPYVFLGPCQFVSHEGSRPMSVVWRLQHPVPARLFRVMARQNIA